VKRIEGAATKTKSELLNYFFQQSVELVWQGMAAGMSADEMTDQLKSAVDEVFGHTGVELIFFECNDYDTTEMGRRLNEVLKLPVEYKNLPFFEKSPAAILKKYDLIITTYHHLAEITETIHRLGFPPGQVIGIDTRLTADTMLRIARFPHSHIGVVCTTQTTAHMIKHVLYGYHPEWEIEAITADQTEAVKTLGQHSDHLIVTHTCVDEVTRLTGRTPDAVVNFQIDEQSIAFLNQRIHQIRIDKLSPRAPHPGQDL
jgi:GntR family transcriptional regulator